MVLRVSRRTRGAALWTSGGVAEKMRAVREKSAEDRLKRNRVRFWNRTLLSSGTRSNIDPSLGGDQMLHATTIAIVAPPPRRGKAIMYRLRINGLRRIVVIRAT